MAFPSVVGTPTESKSEADDATPYTVSRPAGVAGQLTIAVIAVDGNPTLTWPAGYTEFVNVNRGGGFTLRAAYHDETGSEGTTFDIESSASEKWAAIVYSISGAEFASARAPQSQTADGGTTAATTINPPSLTPTGGAKDYLWIALGVQDGEEVDDDTWANTPPSNFTPSPPRQITSGTGGSAATNVSLATAERQVNASVQDPGTFACDVSHTWVAATVAVHPAGLHVKPSPVAGPPVVFDSFTGSENTALTSHTGEIGATWTQVVGSTPPVLTNANRLRSNSVGGLIQEFRASGTCPYEFDVSVDLYIASLVSTHSERVIAGYQDSQNFYEVIAGWNGSNYACGLYKVVNDVETIIGSTTIGFAWAAGETHNIRLYRRDTTVAMAIDGVDQRSGVNTELSGTLCGLGVTTNVADTNTTGTHFERFVSLAKMLQVLAPTISQGTTVSPSPVATTLVVPAPSLSFGTLAVQPSPVAIATIVPAPEVDRGRYPTSNAGLGVTNPTYAYANDGSNADGAFQTDRLDEGFLYERYGTFNFDTMLPSDAVIDAVYLEIEWGTDPDDPARWVSESMAIQAEVGGVPQTSHSADATEIPMPMAAYSFDASGDRSWTRNDLLNANFTVYLTFASQRDDVSGYAWEHHLFDYVRVLVAWHPVLSVEPSPVAISLAVPAPSLSFGAITQHPLPIGGAVKATDAFTDTAGTLLQNHSGGIVWTKHPNSGANAQITAQGGVRASTNGQLVLYYSDVIPDSADYTLEVDVTHLSNDSVAAGVVGRLDTTATTFYCVYYESGQQDVILERRLNGVYQGLGSFGVIGWQPGERHRIGLRMVGDQISILVDGVGQWTVTNSDITAVGRPGLYFFAGVAPSDSIGTQLDDFAIFPPMLVVPTPVVTRVLNLLPTPVAVTLAVPTPDIEQGAGTQYVTPNPVLVTLGVPEPTLLFGTLTVSASPSVILLAQPPPTLAFGAITIAATPVATTLAVPAASVTLGTLTVNATPVATGLTVPAPTIARTLAVAASPVAVTLVVPVASVIRTVAATPVAVMLSVPTPTLAFGGIAIAAPPVAVTLAVPSPTPSFGAVTKDAASVVTALVVPQPTVAFGSLTVGASPVTTSLAVPAATLAFGEMTFVASPVAATVAVPTPSIDQGPVPQTISATPVAVVTSIPAPSVALTLTVSATSVATTLVVPAPTFAFGAITVQASSVGTTLAVPTPTPSFGAITKSAAPVPTTTTVAQPTVAFGAMTLAASPVSTTAAIPVPTVVLGELTLAASPVATVLAVPTPSIDQGPAPQTTYPTPVAIVASVPAPNIGLSLTISATPVALTLAIPAPTVALVLTLAPPPLTVTVTVPAPTVGHSLTLTPAPVAATVAVPVPSLSFGMGVDAPSVPVTLAVPAPTMAFGALTVGATPVAATLAVPVPQVSVGRNVAATPVVVTLVVPTSTIATTLTVQPSPVATTVVVPAPTVALVLLVVPAPVAVSSAVPSPSIAFGALAVTPDPVGLALAVPVPTMVRHVAASPVVATLTVPTAVVALGAITVAAVPVTLLLAVPSALLDFGVLTVEPSPVGAALAVPEPGVLFNTQLTYPLPVVLTLTVPGASSIGGHVGAIMVSDEPCGAVLLSDERAGVILLDDESDGFVLVSDSGREEA